VSPSAAAASVSESGYPGSAGRLRLLDGFELTCDGEALLLPFSVQRLAAYLALHDRPLLRVHVAGTLWPDTAEKRAMASLRSSLWRLGQSGQVVAEANVSHVRLAPRIWVDVREGVRQARTLLDRRDDGGHVDLCQLSLSGELLPDWYEDWVLMERERIRQLRLHALEALCLALTDAGRFGQAVDAGLAAVAAEPLRETAHRVLIRAHLAEGNRCEALTQYRLYRSLLHDSLGVAPSSQMEDLVRSIHG
jgi:DNA-binding SARP family transcriptional activator